MSYERNFKEDNSKAYNKLDSESIFEEFESKEQVSKWLRLANYTLDIIVIQIIIGIIIFITSMLQILDLIITDNIFINYLIGTIFGSAYYVIIETNTQGKSVGKYITNTKVVTLDDQVPDFNTLATRSLCRYIPFNPLSFIGEDSIGWHDSISKTKVVKDA